jgi:hypothetical protein
VTADELARVERHCPQLALGDPDLDPAPDEARVERVVVAIEMNVGLRRDPQYEAAVEVGCPRRQRPQPLPLAREPVDRPLPERAVDAHVRPLAEPVVELVLVVELRHERAARLEARLHEPLQPLHHPLRLTVARVEDPQPDRQLAGERGERVAGPPAAGVERPLAVRDQPARQCADPAQAAPQPPEDVRRLLREDQRARSEARVAERPDHHPARARLAVADRDLAARPPEVELQQLPRPVDSPLVGARAQVIGAHLAHVVINDRLAALKALLHQQLADPLALDPGVGVEQPVDLVLERIQLRPARRPRIDRWPLRAQRPPDRLPM